MSSTYVHAIERDSLALVDVIDHDPLIGSVIRGDASREGYLGFLRSTYQYVRWSGPLLAETAEGIRRKGGTPWLLAIIDAKTQEESPHDGWVLGDLKTCGENVELLKAAAPPVAISAYVDWSRSQAEAGSPGYLGAAYTLEFISAHRAKMAAGNLRARAAIPNIKNAVSFLDGHGDADTDHIATLGEILSRIDDPRDQDAISLSAAVMRALYPLFFSRVPSAGATAVGRSLDPRRTGATHANV
jgi:hypothetical protein